MRTLALITLVVAALAFDSAVLDGRYRRAGWEAAKYYGKQVNSELRYQLKRLGV
jgi:hypothetical protein